MQDFLSGRAQCLDAAAGDYYLVLGKNSYLWPVIICDEDLLPSDIPHPLTARTSSGQWSYKCREGGALMAERIFAVLFLGTNKRQWVLGVDLVPLNSDITREQNHDDAPADLKTTREIANKLHSLDYFKDEAFAQSLASSAAGSNQETTRQIKCEGPTLAKKRNLPGNTKKPPRKRTLFPVKQTNTEDDDDGLYVKEEVHEEHLVGPGPLKNYDKPSNEDDGNYGQSLGRQQQDGARRETTIKEEDANGDPLVTIHIGPLNTKFEIRRSDISKSSVLKQGIVYSIGRSPYIMNPDMMVLNEHDFKAIEQYLKYSEYHPYLVDDGTARARLTGHNSASKDTKEIGFEAIRCGRLYCMAGFLELPSLQTLVLRKIQVMKAYPAGSILETARFVFQNLTNPDDALRKYLIEFIADNFRSLNQHNPKAFWETLDSSDELHRAVFLRKAESLSEFGVLVNAEDD